jgi:LuxR family transcriptional regulator, maltose regulon positive regulatory protein
VSSGPALLQGCACVLSGDLDNGEASLEEAVRLAEKTGAHEIMAQALAGLSLVAMARRRWDQAENLAAQARTALRQAGIEESYVTPLVCAVQARAALHRGDGPAARQQLISAQRVRPLLTYATPHVAVQARIELARVYVALADLAGARTIMREIDRLRPGLGGRVFAAAIVVWQLRSEAGYVAAHVRTG